MNLQELSSPPAANAEVQVNENFESLDHLSVFAKDPATTTGLTWGYLGGRYNSTVPVTAGTVTLTDAATNYVVFHRTTGAVTVATTTTNWDATSTYGRLYKVVAAGGVVSGTPEDHRLGPTGLIGTASGAAGDVVGPASSTANDFAQFDGMTGKLLKGGIALDTDDTLAADSDTRVPSQQAVKAYVDAQVGGSVDADDVTYTPTTLADWDGGTDPGDVEQALDQLAERVADVEGAGGLGDVVGPASSVDGEAALFDSTTGKLLKRATGSGYPKLTSGVQSVQNAAQLSADLQGDGLTSAQAGFRNIPQNSQSAAYTTVAADSGKHLLHPSSDANARTFTIDSNANVAYPVGTAITFVNETSQVLSVAITSDTLTLAGTTTTGTRSLAQNGVATALKVTSTKWIISGTGLT
jgi:hypothetical protein